MSSSVDQENLFNSTPTGRMKSVKTVLVKSSADNLLRRSKNDPKTVFKNRISALKDKTNQTPLPSKKFVFSSRKPVKTLEKTAKASKIDSRQFNNFSTKKPNPQSITQNSKQRSTIKKTTRESLKPTAINRVQSVSIESKSPLQGEIEYMPQSAIIDDSYSNEQYELSLAKLFELDQGAINTNSHDNQEEFQFQVETLEGILVNIKAQIRH